MELHTLTQAACSYALLNCIIRTEPTFQIRYARGASRTGSRPWILWCRWLPPASAECVGSHRLCSSVPCDRGGVCTTLHLTDTLWHPPSLPPSLPHTWHLCTLHLPTLHTCTPPLALPHHFTYIDLSKMHLGSLSPSLPHT